MKRKEKLAREYTKTYNLDETIFEELAYIAGFDRARSMAARIAYHPSFDGTGDQIDCLGEDEVEECGKK